MFTSWSIISGAEYLRKWTCFHQDTVALGVLRTNHIFIKIMVIICHLSSWKDLNSYLACQLSSSSAKEYYHWEIEEIINSGLLVTCEKRWIIAQYRSHP